MTEMPDLGKMLVDAFAQVPGTFVGWVAQNPGPWALVVIMMIGLAALKFASRRRRG